MYIGAYWGDRSETALECGQRLAQCIADLSKVDSIFESWFRRGASRAAAKAPVSLEPESLGELLRKGRNRRDLGGEVIDELGYSIGLWNRSRPAVGLTATVGACPSRRGILNSFVLEFSGPDDEGARLHRPDAAEAIFEAVINAWNPTWATWTTHVLRDAQYPAPREPVIGWLTYLSGDKPAVVDDRLAHHYADGTIIKAAAEFGETQVSTVLAVRRSLQEARALQAIP
jgi:hypothetical protein